LNHYFRKIMIVAIIMGWITYTFAIFAENKFVWSLSLPFQLCNMMQLTALIAYIRNDTRLLGIIVYPLMLGPLIAFSFPEGIYNWGGFFAFYFVYYHVTLVVSSLCYLYIHKCKTSWKQVVYAICFICVCAGIASIVNKVTNGNYMFIGKPIILTSDYFYYAFFAAMCITLIGYHLLIKGISYTIHTYNWKTFLTPKENKKIKYDI